MKETAILTARGWSGAGPWYQTLAFKEPVIDGIVNVIPGASDKQKQAFSNGSIEVSTINGWLVTFKATTNKPIVNIPIEFIYSETGLESLNSVVIVGTKTSSTTFTGTSTKEAFNKLKEGNVPLIVSILDSTTNRTSMSIRMPSYTYDIASNTISAMAPVIPTAGGSLSFWGVLIKGSNLTVSGFVSAGGGGGGGDSVFWGAILGTLTDQTDLATELNSRVIKMSGTSTNHKVYVHTKEGVEGSVLIAEQMDSDGLITGNMAKNYIDTQDSQFILKTNIINDLTTGGATKVASAETVKTLQNEKINTANIKTSWGAIPGDGNVPSEKLTYDTLALKQTIANMVTSLSASSDITHYPSAKTVYDFVLEYAADFKGSVATKADLATITGMNINDWAIVLADETQSGKTTRYGYNGTAWYLQWTVNNTTFTSAQWDTINSGITATKVATYDGYATTIANKLDKNGVITGATKCKITFDAKGLVTAGADLDESDLPAISISKITGLQTTLDAKQNTTSLETDVANLGFTKNVGTITGIKMNGASKGTAGVVDLGTVITSLTGYATTSDLESGLATREASLSDTQHAAVNSGITASKVTTYDGYAATIATKQKTIPSGTADPTGGEDGDYYFQYSE